ncbi:putative peroxisomal acyl-coenzyme A oxidase 1.2 [Cyphellophora attinorum]|uniref:Acyl-coenzyme A oxidase n=1 Tax=Cyphellophora attinorum TaxID=1664694 RepID=A0A0N0NKK4_9EURO|nr:putative peroxisomal acyl-coenzyme A oxidase 1.2 [Phialophora attinorum]KPI38128.1 putative peroxisomal acyl-coenzyme A oxidase 1.2 [Phialophora attinorum]
MERNVGQCRAVPQDAVRSDFAYYLWGGKERFRRREIALDVLKSNPEFAKTAATYSQARKDVWLRIARQSKQLVALKLRHQWSTAQLLDVITMTDWMMPIYPQYRIFMSNIERQMSDQQKNVWLPMAERFEILGCYCQTELGHGSFVGGIETTAVFDVHSDEFVIDSPTLSSTKYWIGAAGVWATHGIVVARLQIGDQDHGPHLFLVQLRDLESHQTLRGINIYELGPKVHQGMLGMDNGASVSREGTYLKPTNTKHAYGSMVTVRAQMAQLTGWDLLKAVVVATHYTKFRKQFFTTADDKCDHEEVTVFEYSSVKSRLIPLLAKATALIIVGQAIKEAYDNYTHTVLRTGDSSALEDLHLQTVASKVYGTEIASRGVEISRIACGGHGYSALAGFGRMYAHTVNAVTYEGDNYVISQQVTRAIAKHCRNGTKTLPPSIAYLSLLQSGSVAQEPHICSAADWLSTAVQEWALTARLASLVQQYLDDTTTGKDTSYSSHALTMAHADYVYWAGFWRSVRALEGAETSFAPHFSLSILSEPHHPSLVHASQLSITQLAHLRDAHRQAINDVAIQSIDTVISAYGLTEFELDSVLARTNRTPYEALIDAAQSSEMSGEDMAEIWPAIVETTKLWRSKGLQSSATATTSSRMRGKL